MNRKILSAIILMSLILSASCGSTPTDGAVTSEEQLTESTETEETTEARIEPDLPDTKWEGYQFRVLTKGDTNVHWKSKDIAATEENGDVINDAVYKRNMKIYDRFGVEMVDIPSPNGTWDLTAPLRKSVMAASDDYDMVASGFNDAVKKECLWSCTTSRTWISRSRGTTRTRTSSCRSRASFSRRRAT